MKPRVRLSLVTSIMVIFGVMINAAPAQGQYDSRWAKQFTPPASKFDTPADVSDGPQPDSPLEMPRATEADTPSTGREPLSGQVPLDKCPFDDSQARECRVHWRPLILSAVAFNALENGANVYSGYWYRWETTHGKWWDRYVNSVEGWRWNRWKDDNPFLDDYVGHPMMGAITNYLWIQNDPKSMTLEQSNTREYWRRMFRAFVFSTFYSFEWKLGPFGEAGIGHNGDHYFVDHGVYTNETGWVELVSTPIGGALWTLAEDALDKEVIRRLEEKSRNPFALLGYQFLNPARATANILRFRPPWYRDSRVVKADSFWSDPPPGAPVFAPKFSASLTAIGASVEGSPPIVDAATVRGVPETSGELPVWPWPGGVHEFGGWWGLSVITGHVFGAAHDIKYMPIDVRYSYLFGRHRSWNVRYSPELTAMAMLDEPVPNQTNPELQRKRTYGSGLSPVGFQFDFRPTSRVQPFVGTNGGFIYFTDRVLSPQGSQFMYTVDLGAGINIFRTPRQVISIGYRYQHLSNADISHHNPGTDANTFYIGASRFRTKGYR